MKTKKRQPSGIGGSHWIRATGKRTILVAVTQEEMDLIDVARKLERLPRTQFLIKYGLAAAEKIVKKVAESA